MYRWVRICVRGQLFDVWNEPEIVITETNHIDLGRFHKTVLALCPK